LTSWRCRCVSRRCSSTSTASSSSLDTCPERSGGAPTGPHRRFGSD
jgi:hypothetical protein